MATTFAKQISFLVLLVLSSYCQTEARHSLFFSKYVHLTTNNNNNYVTLHSTNTKKLDLSSSASPNPAPPVSQISNVPASSPLSSNHDNAPAPAPAPMSGLNYDNVPVPVPSPAMSSNYENTPAPTPMMGSNYENAPSPAPLETKSWYYDSLYANGKSDFSNDKEEEEFSNEELSNRNGEELNSREESDTYNNGYSDNLSNNNAFWTSSNDKSYNINGGYKNEPQGMSDTRLMDNGKYYDNTESKLHENYSSNGYELVKENKNEEGYNGNYQRSKYEFDSMEEYEKEEGYVGVQQEFIP